jgi:hypothetical protein
MVWLRIAQVILGLAGDVWAVFRWLDESGVTQGLELGPPEYAFILVVCTGVAVSGAVYLVPQIIKALPITKAAERLHKLHGEIAGRRRDLQHSAPLLSPLTAAHLYELKRELDALRIPTPELITPDVHIGIGTGKGQWPNFLLHLSGCSRVRDIRGARKLWNGEE